MRYLLFYGSGIGDFVSLLPVAQTIKKHDAEAYIVCFNVSDQKKININKELIECQSYIDSVEYYSKNELTHSLGFILKYFFYKFDYSFLVQHEDNIDASMWPYYICRLISNNIIGYEMKNKKEIRYDKTLPRDKEMLFVKVYLELAKLIGISSDGVKFPLINADSVNYENEILLQKTSKIVVLCVGTGIIGMRLDGKRVIIDAKSWGYERWIDLSKNLIEANYYVIMLGGKKEQNDMNDYDIPEQILNLCGKCSIKESLYVLSKADVVVGADTGLMHCAAALGKTTISLFGCTSEKQYLPYGDKSYFINKNLDCSPCFGKRDAYKCTKHKCMDEIEVREVVNYIESYTI